MSKPNLLLAFVLAVALPLTPALAQGQSQWFVLRNHEVGNCWAATLVRIDGQYSNTFEQKAGGPYETEKQALDRIKALEVDGTCQSN
jgi:hypothetical protein